MSKILKVIDNETIEIKEYVCPEAVFKSVKNPPTLTDIKNEIINFEDYCVFKEIIKPFEMYRELDKYKNIVDKIKKLCDENTNGIDDDGYDDAYYDKVYVREIDEIIEKELKGSDN